MTSVQKTDLKPLVPFFPSMFLCGAAMITLGPLLNSILRETGLARTQGGIFSLTFFLGMLASLGALNFGLGRLSSKRTMLLGAVSTVIGLLVFGVAHGLLWLCSGCFLFGFGYGFLNTFPGIYMASAVKENTERAMTLVYGFFGVGVVITPMLMGRLLQEGFSWRTIVFGEAVCFIFLALYIRIAPLGEIPDRRNLRIEDIKALWGFNRRLWLLILIADLMYVGAEGVFNVWLAKFQIDIFGASEARAGLVVTIFWIGLTLGRFGLMAAMKGGRMVRMALIASSLMALGIVGSSAAPNGGISAALCVVAGLGASILFPIVSGLASRFPAWQAGAVFSSCAFAAGIGTMMLPYFIGPAADIIGFRKAMSLAAVPALLVALMMFLADRAVRFPAAGKSSLPNHDRLC